MNIRIFLISSIMAMLCLNAPVMANSADEATLVSLEQKWIDMGNAKDVDGLNALIDDSYQANTPTGVQSKTDMMKPPAPGVAQRLQNVTAKVSGDQAAVSGDNLITLASGKSYKIRFVDNFERKDGSWRVVSSYVTQ